MRRRRHIHTGTVNTVQCCAVELPLRRKLLIYARNLTGPLTLKAELLDFALSLLSPASRADLRQALSVPDDVPDKILWRENQRISLDAWILERIEGPDGEIFDQQVDEELRRVLESEIAAIKAPALPPGLSAVKRLFRLDRGCTEVLTVIVAYQAYILLAKILDGLEGTSKASALSVMTGLPLTRLSSCCGQEGKLVQCGLVEYASMMDPCTFFRANDQIMECVLGISRKPLSQGLFRQVNEYTYPPACFDLQAQAPEIVRGLLGTGCPCNLLFYGEPGTGKTEFAKSIAAACGKTAYFVACDHKDGTDNRRMALIATVNTVANAGGIVVVDEADELLNTGRAYFGRGNMDTLRKSWLNDFLDCVRAPIIWISNDVADIEQSTRRRFAYAVEFRRHTMRQRRKVWARHLQDHPLRPLLKDLSLDVLARDYRVNAAIIGQALEVMRRIPPCVGDAAPEAAMKTLRALLAGHERLAGRRGGGQLAGMPEAYDPDAVCASLPPRELIEDLQAYVSSGHIEDRPPANLLFWGEPGTGKTAFAQYFARTLEMELLIKRASDLLSMWVGGTEQNIREAFEEAEGENAILFLDEADSFFIDRRSAMRSWETTRTNELLTQMENHHGILICCTNLLGDLDPAAMRRFGWKVRFNPLDNEGRLRLFRTFFPAAAAPADKQTLRMGLERIPGLTPGDFSIVQRRYRLRNGLPSDRKVILKDLAAEAEYRANRAEVMGFDPARAERQ